MKYDSIHSSIQYIHKYVSQPYPLLGSKWVIILSISLFIPLFIAVFQPFGFDEYQDSDKLFKIAGYGLVTFLVMSANLFLVSILLKSWYNEKSWNIAKHIVWLIWIVFTIGLGNYLYSSFVFSFWSFDELCMFQLHTMKVAIIPIVILTVVQQNLLLARNLKSAKEINSNFKNNVETTDNQDEQKICFIADNERDKVEVKISHLIYLESTRNYVELFYYDGNKTTSALIRCSMKRIENQAARFPQLFKCHRSYIVNTSKIVQAKGNSQGLKLFLKNTETEIPVARSMANKLKEIMDTL